jgi:DNA damage-inducible protein 1
VQVGSQYIPTSITVLEQKTGPQFIFGLDNLKRHHCCIDLRQNKLIIGTCDVRLPFLPAQEVPADFNIQRQLPESEVCLPHVLQKTYP